MPQNRSRSAIVYIDGFNLYYGMIYARYSKYKWLDLRALAQSLIGHYQTILEVNYFTSLINDPEDKRLRQLTYVNALAAHSKCRIIKGQYVKEVVTCESCSNPRTLHREKMTDVNIATHLITDTVQRRSDLALLISGDSDLVPAILASKQICPERRIHVRFPPRRHSNHIAKHADDSFVIGRVKFRNAQLPDIVPRDGKPPLVKPVEWR